jgi:NDP-sugar pyrophosphorylase family protein
MKKVKTIIVLAAGDSTRFWPLKNKNLMKFLGKPLAEQQLLSLSEYADSIVVVTNEEKRAEFESIITNVSSHSSCSITRVTQPDLSQGQGGAVLSVRESVHGEAVVLNMNDVFNHADLFSSLEQVQADVVFLAKKVNRYFPGGYLVHENGVVKGIIEKPDPDKVPSDVVKLVADYFANIDDLYSALDASKTSTDDWYEQGLNKLISSGKQTGYAEYAGKWYSLKYPWHVLDVMSYFLATVKETRTDEATVSPTAIITGNVHLGKNVIVGDFVKISGPCFIDDNTRICDYAMVRESMIGKNNLIGGYSEVARSYLGDNVMLHKDYVGDSVIAHDVLIGAEVVTANFRFDQKTVISMVKDAKVDTQKTKMGTIIGAGAKIGVHSTIVPGVKIGSNTYVGPHTLIDKDLKDGKFYYKGEEKDNTGA